MQAQHSVDTAFAAGSLKSLVTARSAAALVDALLNDKAKLTVTSVSRIT